MKPIRSVVSCRTLGALGVALAATLSCRVSHAYEIDTHANITVAAYARSALNSDQSKAQNLGLLKSRKLSNDGARKIDVRLGNQYFDMSGGVAKPRFAMTYDAVNTAVMKKGAPAPVPRWGYTEFDGIPWPYFPGDWMARGAVREDDAGPGVKSCNIATSTLDSRHVPPIQSEQEPIDDIRLALQHSQPLGDSRFADKIEQMTGHRREVKPRGRPRNPVGGSVGAVGADAI